MKTTTEVARELGVKTWHIRHAYDAGYISKPPVFSGRFVFGDNDIATLRNYFSQTRKVQNDTPLEGILNF